MKLTIPAELLQPETLRAVIEEFVTRDGAIHGHAEIPLNERVNSVQAMLRAGRAAIVFDDETKTCTICLTQDLRGLDPNGAAVTPRRNPLRAGPRSLMDDNHD